jgi:hypothetical protein
MGFKILNFFRRKSVFLPFSLERVRSRAYALHQSFKMLILLTWMQIRRIITPYQPILIQIFFSLKQETVMVVVVGYRLCLRVEHLPEAQLVESRQRNSLGKNVDGSNWASVLRLPIWLSRFGQPKVWKWLRTPRAWHCQNLMLWSGYACSGKWSIMMTTFRKWRSLLKVTAIYEMFFKNIVA